MFVSFLFVYFILFFVFFIILIFGFLIIFVPLICFSFMSCQMELIGEFTTFHCPKGAGKR